MFRKKTVKKEAPKSEHHMEMNAQLAEALAAVENAVQAHVKKIQIDNAQRRETLISIQQVCKGT